MIVIADYGRGNIFSITHALKHLGAELTVTADPNAIRAADRIVLPGVGAFGDAMAQLNNQGMTPALQESAQRGTAILGICLGMQMFAVSSEEFGTHRGLGLILGTVRRLPEGPDIRIPNVGWRPLLPNPTAVHETGEPPMDRMMYFVHSFGFQAADSADVAGHIDVNGAMVPALIRRGRLVGCQFHPEKSGEDSLALLAWFLGL